MATIDPQEYNKVKYFTKEKQKKYREEQKKLNKRTTNKRIRRTKEQKVADEQFIWELCKQGLNNSEIHKRLNEERGYNPPLSVMSISQAMRDLRRYHTEHLAYELHPYQEKKIVTAQELLQMALKEFEKSKDKIDETVTEMYGDNGKLIRKTVTKSKKQSSIEWFKMLLQTFKLEQELLGNLKQPSATLNANIGVYNIDGKQLDFNILHQTINKLPDDKYDYYLEKLLKGEQISIDELLKEKKMIIDGEVVDG